MIILRSKITGFQPSPSIKKKEFKQICYSLLGNAHQLPSIDEPEL